MNQNTNNRTTPIRLCLLLAIALATPILLTDCEHRRAVDTYCEALRPYEHEWRIYDYMNYYLPRFDLARIGDIRHWSPGDRIIECELFVSISYESPDARESIAYFNWPEREIHSDSLARRFLRLTPGVDYEVSPDEFYVDLLHGLAGRKVDVAYALTIETDHGPLTIGNTALEPPQYQLLKIATPPQPSGLHELKWRNVYPLFYDGCEDTSFVVEIVRVDTIEGDSTELVTHQDGIPFLELLGLDRFDNSGNPIPDGRIDTDQSVLDCDLLWLTFPDRMPFASDLLDEPVPLLYSVDPYNQGSYQQMKNASRYFIRAGVQRWEPGHKLERIFLIPDSEEVELDGVLLTRGTDYSIDYDYGQLWLHGANALSSSSTLHICYDYAK